MDFNLSIKLQYFWDLDNWPLNGCPLNKYFMWREHLELNNEKEGQKNLTCLHSSPPPFFLLMACRTSVGLLSGYSSPGFNTYLWSLIFTAAVINDISSSTSTGNVSLESLVMLHGQTPLFPVLYSSSMLEAWLLVLKNKKVNHYLTDIYNYHMAVSYNGLNQTREFGWLQSIFWSQCRFLPI